MKLHNDLLDEESSEEEQVEKPEDNASESENNGESEEYEDEEVDEEGDELDDDEDEPPEMETNPKSEQALVAANKKFSLRKSLNGETVKKKSMPVGKLVIEAIRYLNERTGSSTIAIKRVILSNHPDIEEKRLGLQIKRFIKKCLQDGTMAQVKQSFKLTKKLDQDKKKRQRELEKAKKQKQMEKAKQMKKEQKPINKEAVKVDKSKNKNMKADNKENKNPSKAPKTSKAKNTPTNTAKADKVLTKVLTENKGKAKTTKGATPATKTRGRISINLVVKSTPPGPSTRKKNKPSSAGSQKSSAKREVPVATNSKLGTSPISTGTGRKTRRRSVNNP